MMVPSLGIPFQSVNVRGTRGGGTHGLPVLSGLAAIPKAMRSVRRPLSHVPLGETSDYGSKEKPIEDRRFSPYFHLPGFHFGHTFLTHCQGNLSGVLRPYPFNIQQVGLPSPRYVEPFAQGDGVIFYVFEGKRSCLDVHAFSGTLNMEFVVSIELLTCCNLRRSVGSKKKTPIRKLKDTHRRVRARIVRKAPERLNGWEGSGICCDILCGGQVSEGHEPSGNASVQDGGWNSTWLWKIGF